MRFTSKKLSARRSPTGAGIIRRYASIAAAKSWRLKQIIAMIGQTIIPKIEAITMPTKLAYGIGKRPSVGGIIFCTDLIKAFDAANRISRPAPRIPPNTGVLSR